MTRHEQSLRSAFQRGDAGKKPSSFCERRADRGSSTTGASAVERRVDHPLDDGLEQRRLRVEVVVERALRRADLVEHVLDAHLLVALRSDQDLRRVDERVTPHGVDRVVHGACHAGDCSMAVVASEAEVFSRAIRRPTVGLRMTRPALQRKDQGVDEVVNLPRVCKSRTLPARFEW